MKRKINKFLKSTIISYFLFAIINIYLFTVRVKFEDEDELLDHLKNGGSAVLDLSHQHFFVCIKAFKRYLKYNVGGIISKSSDGNVMALIAKLNKYTPIRGSSSRGGKEAMELMIEHLSNKNSVCAHATDGPKGPLGIVKPGSIRIAQKSGAVIFPCFAIANSAWYLSSWDKQLIPKPFSKITIKFGKLITVDSIKTNDDFENKRMQLQNTLTKYIK
ncbi:MAG: lysophospholipid acyltransferase family protein [Desulfobacteraceae bacterium]|nr:lysophospholipid acyltransferase family protein [Desulfobacteraceae bacterium]